MALSRQELLTLAKHGAAARIRELHAEIQAITKHFPELGWRGGRKRGPGRPPASAGEVPTKRKRRRMSKEARKKISEMMKKRWAERRKAKK